MKVLSRTQVSVFLAALSLSSTSAVAQRVLTVNDLERVRQPYSAALSPDGAWVSYVLGDTLWLAPVKGGAEPRAVSAGMANQINYETPFQAWSPKGTRLLFRAGTGGAQSLGTLMVYDLASGRRTPLLPKSYELRLKTFVHSAASGPSWSPNGASVAFLATDTTDRPPGANHLNLYVVDIKTHLIRLVTTDTAGVVGGVASAAWSPDGKWLAYGTGTFVGHSGRVVLQSTNSDAHNVVIRDGGASMYRLLTWSPDGQFLSALRLNAGRLLLRIDNVDQARVASDTVPFTSHGWIGPHELVGVVPQHMNAQLAVWSPGDTTPTLLTHGDTLFGLVGTARVGSKTVVAYTRERGDVPLAIWTAVLTPNSHVLVNATRVTQTSRWLDSTRIAPATLLTWNGPGGDTLDALLFQPPPSLAQPPFPLVVEPYGAYRNRFPKSEYFLEAGTELLATTGWAVVLPNTRDMASHPLTGSYGQAQLTDTRALIDTLVARGIVDSRRVAVIGHSHGGAMAYYYLTHDPHFCAVIAVNGWSDWSQIAERLRAPPDSLPAKLARFSPILNADAVRAPLLAVAGMGDTQVLPENAERMVDTLQALGKRADLLQFSDEGHLLTRLENRHSFWSRAFEFLRASCTH